MEADEEQGNLSLTQKMNAQIDLLNNLISDLLDTTKITERQLVLSYENFNMVDLIRQLEDELQQLTKKHTINITVENNVMVYADSKRIEQVITNLISNAIKYSPAGGEVVIHSEVIEGEVKISVSDNGIGIPEELQEKVFNRFFRVRQPKLNAYAGLGLGLYISAGIVYNHGGTIGVTSNPGKGSIFYFTLPLKQ